MVVATASGVHHGLWLLLVAVDAVLVFHVVGDLFRSPDLTGAAKALWCLLGVAVPVIGALIYLLARGSSTHRRQDHVRASEQRAFEAYLREIANSKE